MENVELVHDGCLQHMCMGSVRMKKETEKRKKTTRMNMEVDTKKKAPMS